MRLAVQIGLPYLFGLFFTVTTGWLLVISFAAKWAPGVLGCGVVLVSAYVALGLAVVDGDWIIGTGWGVLVGGTGFVGGTYVYLATKHTYWGFLLTSLPFAIIAALLSRNLWTVLAGAAGAIGLWYAIPFSVFGRWDAMWSGLHF